jgi:DnaK suppressor protein
MNTFDAQAKETLIQRRNTIQRLFKANTDKEIRLQEVLEPDWPDRAVVRETAVVIGKLADNEQRELAEIDAALERIARGQYGRCEACEAPIGRQRLRAIPEACFCITCTERIENAA